MFKAKVSLISSVALASSLMMSSQLSMAGAELVDTPVFVAVAAAGDAGAAGEPSSADAAQITKLKLAKRMKKLSDLSSKKSRAPLLKHVAVSGEGVATTDLEHLGREQYIAFVTLPAGDVFLEINGKVYDETIPAADGGQEHVILFDHKRPTRPKLTVFKRSLLQFVDSDIK